MEQIWYVANIEEEPKLCNSLPPPPPLRNHNISVKPLKIGVNQILFFQNLKFTVPDSGDLVLWRGSSCF